MIRTIPLLTLCAAAMLPAVASAQQGGDVAYCTSLAQTYQRYVGDNGTKARGQQRNATVDAAIAQCPTDSASSIPVIEQALKNAGFTLPPRG